jgi:hypothetical protein
VEPSITRHEYTTAQVAKAAGVSLDSLRAWLCNDFLTLEGDAMRIGQVAHKFSALDALRVALIGTLARYGIRVSEANDIVSDLADCWSGIASVDREKPKPLFTVAICPSALANYLVAQELHVYRPASGPMIVKRVLPGLTPPALPHGITLRLGSIAGDVARGLRDAAVKERPPATDKYVFTGVQL